MNAATDKTITAQKVLYILLSLFALWLWCGLPAEWALSLHYTNARAASEAPQGWWPLPFLALAALQTAFYLLLMVLGRVRLPSPLTLLPALLLCAGLLIASTYFIPPYEEGFFPLDFGQYSTAAFAACVAGTLFSLAHSLREGKLARPEWFRAAACCAAVLLAYLLDRTGLPPVSSVSVAAREPADGLLLSALTRVVIPMAVGVAVFAPFCIKARRGAKLGRAALAAVALAFLYLYIPGVQGAFTSSPDGVAYSVWKALLSNIGSPAWAVMAGAVAGTGVVALTARTHKP